LAHAFAQLVVAEDLEAALGHGVGVAHRHEVAGLAVDDDLGQAAGVRGDDRDLGGHRFERGHAERLGLRRQEKEIAAAEDSSRLGTLPRKMTRSRR
jgi:hypothetical protein